MKNQPAGRSINSAMLTAIEEATGNRLLVRIDPTITGFSVVFEWTQAGRPAAVVKRRLANRQDCHDLASSLARRLGLRSYEVEDRS